MNGSGDSRRRRRVYAPVMKLVHGIAVHQWQWCTGWLLAQGAGGAAGSQGAQGPPRLSESGKHYFWGKGYTPSFQLTFHRSIIGGTKYLNSLFVGAVAARLAGVRCLLLTHLLGALARCAAPIPAGKGLLLAVVNVNACELDLVPRLVPRAVVVAGIKGSAILWVAEEPLVHPVPQNGAKGIYRRSVILVQDCANLVCKSGVCEARGAFFFF